MNYLFLALFLIPLISFQGWAQSSHLGLRINQSGIQKLLGLVADYNIGQVNTGEIKIPKNFYKFNIPISSLSQNPIISILNEISDVNFNADFPFFLESSDILIKGNYDKSSLKVQILNQGDKKIRLSLKMSINQLRVDVSKLKLCDQGTKTKCHAEALSVTADKVSVSLIAGSLINLNAILDVDLSGKNIKVNLVEINTNLDNKIQPKISINMSQLTVPPISIFVNGNRTDLDTSGLREKILEKSDFLGRKLLGFAGEFMALDLVDLINVFLAKQNIPTSFDLLNYSSPIRFNEILMPTQRELAPRDNTYVHQPVYLNHQQQISNVVTKTETQILLDMLMGDFFRLVRQMNFSLSLDQVNNPFEADLEMFLKTKFSMNNRNYNVLSNIHNSNRVMGDLTLSQTNRQQHLHLALSTPLINSALLVANQLGLIRKLVDYYDNEPGFWVDGAEVHIPHQNLPDRIRLHLVAQAKISLKDLGSKDFLGKIENLLGAFLERNNNNGVIYFPLELQIDLRLVKNSKGESQLVANIASPFIGEDKIKNSYSYATNFYVTANKVRTGIVKSLKERLSSVLGQEYPLNLSPFLSQQEIVFQPQKISVHDLTYLIFSLNLSHINFKALEK